MKTYIGKSNDPDYPHVGRVTVMERIDDESGKHYDLQPRLDLRNHSPTGFAWGYGGSGPAQLALAILADVTGDDDVATRFYQYFKFDEIASIPQESAEWELGSEYILEWLEAKRKELDG